MFISIYPRSQVSVDRIIGSLVVSLPEPKARGELIGWYTSRRPCVRLSVRASTFSKIFFSYIPLS